MRERVTWGCRCRHGKGYKALLGMSSQLKSIVKHRILGVGKMVSGAKKPGGLIEMPFGIFGLGWAQESMY